MPHADTALFPPNLSKPAAYNQLLESLASLLDGQRNWVTNLANTSSLLWHMYASLPPPLNSINWVGFYTLDPLAPTQHLVLAPFMGKPACQTIALGEGVCGHVAQTGEGRAVTDVGEWKGHIACDGETRSEVVVAVRDGEGRVRAVLDVDCTVVGGVGEEDLKGLEGVAGLVGRGCDW